MVVALVLAARLDSLEAVASPLLVQTAAQVAVASLLKPSLA
jgi:hypothetical protein